MRTSGWIGAAVMVLMAVPGLRAQERGVPRFEIGKGAVARAGAVRPGAYLGDEGRRAAIFGDEGGSFEVWTWPVKLVRDLHLAFKIPEYDEPIDGSQVARSVIVQPEGFTIVYSHATFTVRQHVFVPLNEAGVVMLLEVQTVRPLEVFVRMHADFNLAWPGSFGGGYITWQGDQRRFLLSQGGVGRYNGFVGSPFATDGTSHPAHDAPMVPSQFILRFDTARASTDFIPIILAGGAAPRDSVAAVYERLLTDAATLWREKVAHYESVDSDLLTMHSPVSELDQALAWAKVNLDQQLVCNPDLGCGLVAGFGPAGPGNFRPGFGWFFGGDAAINSLAMDGLGQFALVRRGLEFLARYQRDDGKIPHEISQSAGRLPWFTEYPYTFFHGDTTPFWLLACYQYWLASGDTTLLRQLWPQLVRAYRWSAATDRNGDGLMENPAAGAGAIEVGGLGADLLTDIYLAGVWTASLEGVSAMAAAMGDDRLATDARTRLAKARGSLEKEFWLEKAGIYAFALLQGEGGRVQTNDALTVWPTTALTFGLLQPERADRMLQAVSSAALTSDWGVRALSWRHPLYDPMHYNNGTVWDFLTGFAALAQYRYHRSWAGYELVRDVARTTFDFARGRNPELMSGAFYRTLDTAVPQQFFATSMLVSPLVRGLLGWSADAPGGRATLAPHLPADWDSVRVNGLAVGSARLDVRMERGPGRYVVQVHRRDVGGPALRLRISPGLPLGAHVTGVTVDGAPRAVQAEETLHDVHPAIEVNGQADHRVEFTYEGGVEILPARDDIQVGDPPRSLRVLDFRRTGDRYTLLVEGRTGTRYAVRLRATGQLRDLRGAQAGAPGPYGPTLEITIPAGASSYQRLEISFRL